MICAHEYCVYNNHSHNTILKVRISNQLVKWFSISILWLYIHDYGIYLHQQFLGLNPLFLIRAKKKASVEFFLNFVKVFNYYTNKKIHNEEGSAEDKYNEIESCGRLVVTLGGLVRSKSINSCVHVIRPLF